MSVLVGRKAPDFTVPAVLGNGEIVDNFNFKEATKNKYGLLIFYPLNFTFVCPSELIAIEKRMPRFKKLGVEVIGVSIDSHFSHHKWRNTDINKGGIGQVTFTLAADIRHAICQAYGVQHPEAGVAFRAAFIIDQNGVVRSQLVNDLPLGRNIDELLRLIEALQFHEKYGEVCPAGWTEGKKGMVATPDGVAKYLNDNHDQL
ncbi:MAG: peroxiredoxin C [Gammaproteobacteria bacterium]|nr:peroxiredoxin C [Gammaproteobacteria bacterium]